MINQKLADKRAQLLREKSLEQQKLAIQYGLPHLYSFKWYKWARLFFESTNRMNLLTAANQISKSSTQIRKAIHWATAIDLWPKLWKRSPKMIWYLYPSKDVASVEWEKKWKPEFMPRNEYKEHPQYGWEEEYSKQEIYAVHFKTGVSIFFKSYMQDAAKLQSGTVDMLCCDEELPAHLFDELNMRMAASEGYFHMVFTATLGQELWYKAIERIGKKDEMFPNAFKMQVSMWDCQYYEDGSPSLWTSKRIKEVEQSCASDQEIQRRVYGRFVLSEGLRVSQFSAERNVISKKDFCLKHQKATVSDVINNWVHYSGVDIGSGGPKGHPAACVFVAVRPDFKYGVVHRGWKGDKTTVTTAQDILTKYRLLRSKNWMMTLQTYDWASKDFHTFACSLGESFYPAEKDRTVGFDKLNILFKNDMLDILEEDGLDELVVEMANLLVTAKDGDDFTDALRYAINSIPWNMDAILDNLAAPVIKEKKEPTEIEKRRKFVSSEFLNLSELEAEIEEINALLEY